MKITYDEARDDFEYLEEIAELDDQVELDSRRLELMQNPTKKTAASMYCSAIGLWFLEHGTTFDNFRRVRLIRETYGV